MCLLEIKFVDFERDDILKQYCPRKCSQNNSQIKLQTVGVRTKLPSIILSSIKVGGIKNGRQLKNMLSQLLLAYCTVIDKQCLLQTDTAPINPVDDLMPAICCT